MTPGGQSVETERPDENSYPEDLSGDVIMQEAKIIAAANAFAAMSGSRVYRAGMPVNEVIDAMLEQADQLFDRHVLAALFHVAENRSDWKNCQAV
ncbi:MAG: hypothetical protein JSW45_01030 [Thiotrichales bacterium]|nr:MAG: hypothetical protein JSW45_01030 [Thiotrichales bacterium]